MKKPNFHFIASLCFLCAVAFFSQFAVASEYMHNSKDDNANELNLAEIADSSQAEFIVSEALPENAKGKGVLALTNQSVQLKNPVLSNNTVLENLGKILRFHIWIKAEDIKTDNLWFGSPTVTFQLFDDNGNQLVNASSLFKTRGTYPWHCYYVDVKLPAQIQLTGKATNALDDDLQALLESNDGLFGESAGSMNKPGLYVTFSSLGTGTAWFGGLSYDVLTAAQVAVARKDWMDELSGTNAPNPEYDELPMILYYGISADKPWKFLEEQNLLTNQGLYNYLEANRNDWFHLQKGFAMLPYLYTTASTLQLCPEFESGWLETLRGELTSLQDPETGFWTVNGIPNLLATEAIASGCFSPMSQKRSDVSSVPTPWNSIGAKFTLPYAGAIIDTLLANRVVGTVGWNEFMLQPKEFGERTRDNSISLGATTAAVKLLLQAANALPAGEPRRTTALEAVKKAYEYVIATFVTSNPAGLWRESTTATDISATGAFLLDFLDAVPVLEHRVNPALPAPTVDVISEHDKGIRVVWKNPPSELVAVRIYGTRANVKTLSLTEKNICCFIERRSDALRYEDPLVVARKIVDAARTEWKITPEDVGCNYLAGKVSQLPKRLPMGKAEKTINVDAPAMVLYTVADDSGDEDTSIVFYAVGVNAYGETTDYILLQP